jgi:hypothetical protein
MTCRVGCTNWSIEKPVFFLDHPDQRLRGYFAQSTLFLLSQYFAWMELTRRDLQFVDLGDDEETKKLYELTERIAERFSHGDDINVYTGAYTGTTALWIFKMEQRAIGESMIIEENGKPSCLGYGAFVERLDSNPLLALLGSDLADRAKIESNCNRLVDLQHALVDLIVFLDKEGIRFAENRIKKAVKLF